MRDRLGRSSVVARSFPSLILPPGGAKVRGEAQLRRIPLSVFDAVKTSGLKVSEDLRQQAKTRVGVALIEYVLYRWSKLLHDGAWPMACLVVGGAFSHTNY
jgi:hypothetical protein